MAPSEEDDNPRRPSGARTTPVPPSAPETSQARDTLGSSLDLRRLVRRNLLRLLLSLLILGALTALAIARFRPELDSATEFMFAHLGLSGVIGMIFITDSLISPLPPDTLLILISASEYASQWPVLIPFIGAVSALAGIFGYSGGRILSRSRVAKAILEPFHTQSQEIVDRYGGWGVALGALTPIPFSITCWSAGLLKVRFGSVWPACLLRIPRYVLYYVVIALSERAAQL